MFKCFQRKPCRWLGCVLWSLNKDGVHQRNHSNVWQTKPASVCCHSYHSKCTLFNYFYECLDKKCYIYNVFAVYIFLIYIFIIQCAICKRKDVIFQARACTFTSTAPTSAPARVRARRPSVTPSPRARELSLQSGTLSGHERWSRGRARRGRFFKAGARTCASPRSLLCGGIRTAQIQ